MRWVQIFAVGTFALCAGVIRVPATTITVTNINDSGPGSLRQALAEANDGDTIDFAVTGSIGLTNGELQVDKSITISGPGAGTLAVDGNAKSRVFHIATGETVTISGLTITNGHSTGLSPDVGGAGIYNDHAMLTVDNCALTGNTVDISGTSAGGAIFNDGTGGAAILTITNSTLNNNLASDGGAIYNAGQKDGSVTVAVSNSTLSENSARNYGGGMESVGLFGPTTLVLVTFDNSTLSGNAVSDGDAISNVGATVELSNSILNEQPSGEQIFNLNGVVMSHGYNLSSDDDPRFLTGPGDQINSDPMLGPLRNNGGSTLTHRPSPGSPALDAGDPNFTPPPFYDQRGPGFDRVVNGRIDIGSFEVQPGKPPPPPTPRPRPTPHPRPTPR